MALVPMDWNIWYHCSRKSANENFTCVKYASLEQLLLFAPMPTGYQSILIDISMFIPEALHARIIEKRISKALIRVELKSAL